MDAFSMPVTKMRFSGSDSAISKEVGFDVRTPKGIDLGSGRGKLVGEGKMIEESAENGRLRRFPERECGVRHSRNHGIQGKGPLTGSWQAASLTEKAAPIALRRGQG